jgi:hypothetical protein
VANPNFFILVPSSVFALWCSSPGARTLLSA